MLNPEGGKNGKSPRRRAASMDNNSKFTKSRGRAAKKKVKIKYNIKNLALLCEEIVQIKLWSHGKIFFHTDFRHAVYFSNRNFLKR